MEVYIGIFVSSILLSGLGQLCDKPILRRKNAKYKHDFPALIMVGIAVCILILVAGFRYEVGTDFSTYSWGVYGGDTFFDRLVAWDEPFLYGIYYLATSLLGFKAGMCFVLVSVFTLLPSLIVTCRYSEKLCLAIVLWLIIGCWTNSFNAIRQSLAVTIVFCGFGFLKRRDYIKYILMVLLATGAHKAAIVLALFPLIVMWGYKERNILIYIGFLLVASFFTDRFLAISGLILSGDSSSVSTLPYANTQVALLRILSNVAPFVFFAFIGWEKKRSKASQFYMNILLTCAIMSIVSAGSAYLAREVQFFAPFCVVAIAELCKEIPGKNRSLCTLIIVVCYLVFWLVNIQSNSNLLPWQWSFNDSFFW